jgi:hypothetical protein
VATQLEFDPRNVEFRQANANWTVVPGLVLTAGKTNTFFQQISWLGGGRQLLVGAKYSIPGLGWIGAQVANKSDITFVSSGYAIFEPLTSSQDFSKVGFKQDPWINVIPAIAFKPDLGKEFSLEVGANAYLVPQQIGAPSNPTGASVDAYFTVAALGFTFTNEFTFWNLNDSNKANQEMTYFAQLTYNAGTVAPTVYFLYDVFNADKGSTASVKEDDPNAFIAFELPITVAKNFKINPMFSYAIMNYNQFFGNYSTSYNKNDWSFGIRFDYSFSSKF